MAFEKTLPKKSENVSEWYNAIILQAELAEYGPAKGTMIIRPYGYAIWEEIQKNLDADFKKRGVENAYFPLFIPESMINKEKHHIEGFSPELAVVTIGGGEELTEKLIVRPTSETIIGTSFSRWVKSWRDLPMILNQWANVVRWEKRTYLFMRTTEFLWQEGHTAHATHEDAVDTEVWAMNAYESLFRNFFALPGYRGIKSRGETFAGAEETISYETLMPEGKALQSATSHDLGQNFAKVFDITFQNKKREKEFVWQTSWGLSTRTIGALILAHGDDKGLRLPPKLAPFQVVIIPVRLDDDIIKECVFLKEKLVLAGIRVKFDDKDETLGFKINKWEMKGAPLRLEVGKRELESGTFKSVRRDNGKENSINKKSLVKDTKKILDDIQDNMFEEAEKFLKENTYKVNNFNDFKKIMETTRGFLEVSWCENSDCEEKIKQETKATTRCKIEGNNSGECIYCGKPSK